MIHITLNNADSVDMFVLTVDNQQPGSPVVFNQRLNQGQTSGPVQVQEDGSGKFSITTTGTDANDSSRFKVQGQTGTAGDQVDVKCS
jgi:hypothetical protein